ncbi:TcpE family conjugal transfer membrane protein [Enterococcus gallinarum]|uniref:TcpE family conjugal transfer membrane protein n=1 Tax=Enterococcus gallinarum TaxID=1353 RepID=UPI0018A980F4|nr:TcpE family conjugal transfer membrane protein [Enterococcus gallinarum]
MNDWEPYNYTSVFKEPYRIQDIPNVMRLPFSIVVVDAVTAIVVGILVYLFFGSVIASLAKMFQFMYMLCYVGLPIWAVMVMNKIQPDGKKIYYYLLDSVIYYFTVQLPDIVICEGKKCKRKELTESIRFK